METPDQSPSHGAANAIPRTAGYERFRVFLVVFVLTVVVASDCTASVAEVVVCVVMLSPTSRR